MAAQPRGQPDALDLGGVHRGGTDVGLEEDLVVLDPDDGVAVCDETGDERPVAARGAAVRRVADLVGEHRRRGRHDDVHLLEPGEAHAWVGLDPGLRGALGGGQQWLVRPDRPRPPPRVLEDLPEGEDLLTGPEDRRTSLVPAADSRGEGLRCLGVALHRNDVGGDPAEGPEPAPAPEAEEGARRRAQRSLLDPCGDEHVGRGVPGADLQRLVAVRRGQGAHGGLGPQHRYSLPVAPVGCRPLCPHVTRSVCVRWAVQAVTASGSSERAAPDSGRRVQGPRAALAPQAAVAHSSSAPPPMMARKTLSG